MSHNELARRKHRHEWVTLVFLHFDRKALLVAFPFLVWLRLLLFAGCGFRNLRFWLNGLRLLLPLPLGFPLAFLARHDGSLHRQTHSHTPHKNKQTNTYTIIAYRVCACVVCVCMPYICEYKHTNTHHTHTHSTQTHTHTNTHTRKRTHRHITRARAHTPSHTHNTHTQPH